MKETGGYFDSGCSLEGAPDYNDGDWHGWAGGECPVHPESDVVVRYSQGPYHLGKASVVMWHSALLFRVTKEHKEPRDFWIKGGVAYGAFVKGAVQVREVLE